MSNCIGVSGSTYSAVERREVLELPTCQSGESLDVETMCYDESLMSSTIHTVHQTSQQNVHEDDGVSHAHSQCSLYMAMSTIAGAGLGTFTGRDRQVNDEIGYGDVMLPIYDLDYHLQSLGPAMAQRADWEYMDPTRDYVWYGTDLGMQRETAHPDGYISGKCWFYAELE
jgi:hypothetical protein